MKNTYTIIFSFILIIIISSCSTYNFTINILVPADITISQDIQTVGVINRSLPEKSNLFRNILEGLISGESIFADREGSFNTSITLVNSLNMGPRFNAVLMEEEHIKGTGTKEFPNPLNWEAVNELSEKYDIDAIISLETFDSDILIKKRNKEKKKIVEKQEITYIEYYADLYIKVNSGWRIYDNVNKKIIDHQVFTDEKSWKEAGLSYKEAINKLPNKRIAINNASIFSGEMMAGRISPKWIYANRTYFVKAKDEENFKLAKSQVKVKNWKEAARLMSQLTNSENRKIAAKACHNMAVSAEMEDKIDIAYEWAKKAYTLHGKSIFRNYANELYHRIIDIEKLNKQLEN